MTLKLPLLLDGATGTELQKRGMPRGVCTEAWILEHPKVLEEVQKAYLQAGADVLTAPTFGASPAGLARFGLENLTDEYNRRLVELTRRAGGEHTKVAGNLAPCGLNKAGGEKKRLFAESYRAQAAALQKAGVDLYLIETMVDLEEAGAAVQAVGEADGGKPVLVTFYCDDQGRIPDGKTVEEAMAVMEEMGVFAFGLNCTPPETAQKQLERLAPRSKVPLMVQPEGGGRTPETFRGWVERFHALGVRLFGGCCQTGPEVIAVMRKRLEEGFPL